MNAELSREPLTRSVEDYLKAIYSLSPEGQHASTSDIAHLLDAVRAVGVEQVVVVDLTRPGIGLPVARVVVPGLEGPGGHLPGARARHKIEAVAAAAGEAGGS